MFEDIIKSLRICADDRSCMECIMKDQGHCPCGCFDALMTKAADELETAANVIAGYSGRLEELRKQVPHWISAEDQLPDLTALESDWVLGVAYGKVNNVIYEGAVVLVSCENGEWWLANEPAGLVRVTHWMPLPEEPKEEQHES